MNSYQEYEKSICKIFDILEKLKKELPNSENISFIDSIYEYKDDVLNTAELLKSGKPADKIEALGND